MAKTAYTKYIHEKQRKAIPEIFERYKNEIAEKIIEKQGVSYQRAVDIKDNWINSLKYSKELEKFVIQQTKYFLANLPINGIHDSQIVLKNLSHKISVLLANYSYRENIVLTKTKFLTNKKRIYDEIFLSNKPIQHRITECNKTHQRTNEKIENLASKKSEKINNVPVKAEKPKPEVLFYTPEPPVRKNMKEKNAFATTKHFSEECEIRMSKKELCRRIAETKKELMKLGIEINIKRY